MKTSIASRSPGFGVSGTSATLLGFLGQTGVDAVNPDDFISAMRNAASGVNIVTTNGKGGRVGLTVSAFTSVSAEPPMVLVCVNRKSPACEAILENRVFCANVLALRQQALANAFAGRPAVGDAYDFAAANWTSSVTGAPMLDGAIASFDCHLATALNCGSHTVFIGQVVDAKSDSADPLTYHDRAYGTIRRIPVVRYQGENND